MEGNKEGNKKTKKQEKIDQIAIFLWLQNDRYTRLTDDWTKETDQRKMKWLLQAQQIMGIVDSKK